MIRTDCFFQIQLVSMYFGGSPKRKTLLGKIDISLEARVSDIDEDILERSSIKKAKKLAYGCINARFSFYLFILPGGLKFQLQQNPWPSKYMNRIGRKFLLLVDHNTTRYVREAHSIRRPLIQSLSFSCLSMEF